MTNVAYRLIEGDYDIRAWPAGRSEIRWYATIADKQTKAILATGAGMSRDAAIADARGKLLPQPEEIVRDRAKWRSWASLAVGVTVICWCAYIALHLLTS